MSRNIAEHKRERKVINAINQATLQGSQTRTLQGQGSQSIQVGYTPDSVFPITLAPASGLIGTFLCTLQYDDPQPDSVVFGDLDIAVNQGTDDYANNLSVYFGGLHAEVINDGYLEKLFHDTYGYHPIVKTVRLTTTPSMVSTTFYIHTRWRYVGVGNVLQAVTGDISILP
jgi:hypothetical protein